jgi:hypothetical protein
MEIGKLPATQVDSLRIGGAGKTSSIIVPLVRCQIQASIRKVSPTEEGEDEWVLHIGTPIGTE